MTILHVDTGRVWRGGQRQVLLLAAGLARRGVRNVVMAPDDSPLLRRARAEELEAVPLRLRGDLDLPGAWRLRAMVGRQGADVVHAHDARAHAAGRIALALPLSRSRPALVVSRRSAFPPRREPFTWLKYARGTDRFVAVSGVVAAHLRELGVESERIRVIADGVDLQPAEWQEDWHARFRLPAEAIVVGSAGALSPEKGYHDLVDALGLLDHHVHAVVLGEGPERAALLARAEERGVSGRLHLVGFTQLPREAVAGLDVYVQPSLAEGLGSAAAEALALGVPTITTTAGGLAEVVEPEVSGLQVKPGDVAALAAAISRLACDPELRQRLGEAGRERAQRFGTESMVDRTLELYRELAGS